MTDTSANPPHDPLPSPPSSPDDGVLDRYLADQLPAAESSEIASYVDARPEWRRFVWHIRSWLSAQELHDAPDEREAYGRFRQRWTAERSAYAPGTSAEVGNRERNAEREQGVGLNVRSNRWARLFSRRPLLGSTTAIGALTILVAAVLITRPSTNTVGATPAAHYVTRAGQRSTVRLADGTRVTLGPQTSLDVGQDFGTRHRTVAVTGEAYFEVTPTARQPFTVHAAHVTSRVLGTAFTIRHYPADRDVQIAVRSGRVSIDARTPVVLTQNMTAHVTDSTVTVAADADLREYIEWTNGRLVFSKARVGEVVTTLGQWYGLEFRFADSTIADRHITAVFDADARQEVLQTLQLMLDVRMKFDGNTVTLVPTSQDRHAERPLQRRQNAVTTTQAEVGR